METDIDAISVAIPCFGVRFSLVYMTNLPDISFPQKFQLFKMADVYRKYSYNFATENDTKVISATAIMFQDTPDPPPPASRLRRYLFPLLIY